VLGVVRAVVGQGGEMTQALYAHINNNRKKQSLDKNHSQNLYKCYLFILCYFCKAAAEFY
jgi:hypothetical protein